MAKAGYCSATSQQLISVISLGETNYCKDNDGTMEESTSELVF
jgi:hypothetical protein